MIISISFRHNTEDPALRQKIAKVCQNFSKDWPEVTRLPVIFYKEAKDSSHHYVICLIGIEAPQKKHLNIYEQQENKEQAFNRAVERVVNRLSRNKLDYIPSSNLEVGGDIHV